MRIGLLHRQQSFAEFKNGNWRVWYIFNNDVTSGTYYELQTNGICDRVTVLDGDVLRIDRVRNADHNRRLEDSAAEFAFLCNYSV